jgi:hypothetical protein
MMYDEKMIDLHNRIRELRDDLRSYAGDTHDQMSAALCETGAEVVGGLEDAFDHYMYRSEAAWQ